MKKLALKIQNSLMKTKDPFLFSTVLFCLMLIAYICGWNHITPMSAINGAIKMWTEEEITVIKASE